MTDFTYRIHPEKSIDGFTALDGTIRFYGFVRAVMLRDNVKNVLDFGAGRGAGLRDPRSVFKLHLADLRKTGAKVTAADVDKAVMTHPGSDDQVVLTPGAPLPFADGAFDLIVSDNTFEHLEDPAFVAKELLRVLKPGGYVCARTPNRLGYVRFISGLVPNRLHALVLKWVQPERESEDVFPAFYRLNSPQQAREVFQGKSVYYFYENAEPAYHFNNYLLYRAFMSLHRLLPLSFSTFVCLFIRND